MRTMTFLFWPSGPAPGLKSSSSRHGSTLRPVRPLTNAYCAFHSPVCSWPLRIGGSMRSTVMSFGTDCRIAWSSMSRSSSLFGMKVDGETSCEGVAAPERPIDVRDDGRSGSRNAEGGPWLVLPGVRRPVEALNRLALRDRCPVGVAGGPMLGRSADILLGVIRVDPPAVPPTPAPPPGPARPW